MQGNIFMDLKKWRDAMNHFGEALQIAPNRYQSSHGVGTKQKPDKAIKTDYTYQKRRR